MGAWFFLGVFKKKHKHYLSLKRKKTLNLGSSTVTSAEWKFKNLPPMTAIFASPILFERIRIYVS
jgi:hypothetical protein